ncbi:branched-chain amino acid ABC transporter substrate-binding protein [Actinomadura fulvescens]|uniref:Branched-chain amino acid ABC transporter substrate-binding protein n=1 Tax=Actinomadura fulvescens TaxID=46160 RepID=A0ABN3QAP3_9ACTN
MATPTTAGGRSSRRSRLIFGIGLPVALAAVGTTVVVLVRSGEAGDDFPGTARIGVMGPMSGKFQSSRGTALWAGAQLAVAEYNSANPPGRAELVRLDTKNADPQEGTRQAREAVRLGVDAVVGPMMSGESQQAVEILAPQKIPSVSPTHDNYGLSGDHRKYWFTMRPDFEKPADDLARLVVRQRETEKVVVVDDGLAPTADVFEAGVKAGGKSVRRVRIPVPPDDEKHDFRPAAKQLKDADAIYYGGVGDRTVRLIREARAAGFTGRFYLGDGSLNSWFLKEAANGEAEGSVLICSCVRFTGAAAVPLPPRLADFASRYAKANGGKEPADDVPEAYDSTWAILHAVKDGKRTGEQISDYLIGMSRPGATQRIRFDAHGLLLDSVSYAYQVKGGRFVFLGDSTAALR